MSEDKTSLSAETADAELKDIEGWHRDNITIARDFKLANFKDITSFLNHLVKTITEQNHHPDFSLDTGSRTVSVAVTTHSAGAVTRADILFARTLNAWEQES
jgi:pterin-4a-carbinolamine dehydratase